MNHIPGQVPCERTVGQHKMDSMIFMCFSKMPYCVQLLVLIFFPLRERKKKKNIKLLDPYVERFERSWSRRKNMIKIHCM